MIADLAALLGIAIMGLGNNISDATADPTLTPDIRRQIDALAGNALIHQHVAGLSLAVARDGNIIYARGYGYRDRANLLPARANTIYNIASMTKQFTAASIMLLQQDGKLSIDDRLSKYIPDFPNADKITLRHLLNHTSGLADYLDLIDNNTLSLPKILSALREAPLKFSPGSMHQYSNSNYIVLGDVVRRVSGTSFDDFLRQRIFWPLRLVSTSIGTAPKDLRDGAIGYTIVNGKTMPTPPQSRSQLDYSDGGVNSTVLDLIKWDAALDAGRVVNDDLLKMMFTPGPHGDETTSGYGLGLRVRHIYGHREIVHAGEWTGYAGENATFPDDRLAIVMLSNTDAFNESLLTKQIFALFYPPALAQRAADLKSAPGENLIVTAAAKQWLSNLALGTLSKQKMTPELRASTTPAALAYIRREIKSYGKLERFVFVERNSSSLGITDTYRLFYPVAIVSFDFGLTKDGKIRDFLLARED